jgi:microsomal epoxide hydrolase
MLRALALAICLLCLQPFAAARTTPEASPKHPHHTSAQPVQAARGLDCQKGRPVRPAQIAAQDIACRPAILLKHGYADRYFTSSDGVRLHYLEGGENHDHTIVFIPGWTMPAWIWMRQLDGFSDRYHTVAFDPRGQGDSAVPATGYEPGRRGRDISDLIAHLKAGPVTIVAWSLGVLDTLAMIHAEGDRAVAALVLVDNSVGEDPPPVYHPAPPHRGPPLDHSAYMRHFVAAMFRSHQAPDYLARLAAATLRTPEYACRLLLAYPVPRSYWREAVYATSRPLLYVVRPHWLAQGENLLRNRPNTELRVFDDAGHALFIDDTARFNAILAQFLRQKVWP